MIIKAVIFSYLLFACSLNLKQNGDHFARIDFRLGNKYYSLFAKENGECYVTKGLSSDYMDSFIALTADTSVVFHLDSAKVFFKKLREIRFDSLVVDHHSDAPRVEIYYDTKKVYDSHLWNERFWDIFRPIIKRIPNGYNPFLANEKPFG